MKKIIKSIKWGYNIADIIELKNGYEARVGNPTKINWEEKHPTQLTWEEKNPPIHLYRPSEAIERLKKRIEEKRPIKNTNTCCKEVPRLCLESRFIYKKISGHYLIMEESSSGARTYSEPIKILEPDLPKNKVKEICLELLINEASKQ